MAAEEHTVKIKTTADLSGTDKAAQGLDNVGKSAKKAGSDGNESASVLKTAFNGFSSAVGSAAKVVGTFTRALGFIGLAVHAVEMLSNAFHALMDWIKRDEIAAAKLAEEIKKNEYAESVSRVAREYEVLNAKVAENLRLEQQKNGLLDERRGMERNLEDANMRKEEAEEIKALDENDPDYAAKASLVRQKYARKRSETAAARAGEDNREEVARIYAAAEAKDKEAAEYRKQSDWGSDAKRNVIEKRAEYAETSEAARKGDKEAQEKLETVKKEYEAAKEAYDKIRKAAAEAEKAAQELRNQAANKMGGNMAAKIANEATQAEIDVQERDTKSQMNKAAEERKRRAEEDAKRAAEDAAKKKREAEEKSADEVTVEEGGKRIEAIKGSIRDTEGMIGEAEAEDAKEQREAWQAKQNLETFNANHAGRKMSKADREEQKRLTEVVEKETAEAQESSFKLGKTLSRLNDVLNGFNDMLKQVQREVEAAEKRNRSRSAEAPAGE